ncbi:MAG: FtsX-like permease family protein [Nitrospira sp.]|nr:FtsX-like permease family protein [Nitrospira sp.]
MTLGRLVLRNTVRRPVRMGLTVAGLAMVVLAFGLIRLTLNQWTASATEANKNRLVTVHAMSGALKLPLAYKDRIAALPGVQSVHFDVWFGGIYQDPKQTPASFAGPPATLLSTYPEILLSEESKLRFIQDRRGCIVGVRLAERHGWKIGDVIPLTGTAYPGQWEVVVRGIYRSSNVKVFSDEELLLHWDYVNEQIKTTDPTRADQVDYYATRTLPGFQPSAVAAAIDAIFANFFAETRTQLEQAFVSDWIARSGTLLHGLEIMSGVINGIALLILANVLAMAVRERTKEYGVLKTLGFQPRHFFGLVIGESLLLALLGGALGLGLLYPTARLYGEMTSNGGYVPTSELTADTVGLCFVMMLLVGIVASLWPALRLIRTSALDELRHVG